jgi:hypothetical protein
LIGCPLQILPSCTGTLTSLFSHAPLSYDFPIASSESRKKISGTTMDDRDPTRQELQHLTENNLSYPSKMDDDVRRSEIYCAPDLRF